MPDTCRQDSELVTMVYMVTDWQGQHSTGWLRAAGADHQSQKASRAQLMA
jgi:hypothetical protein